MKSIKDIYELIKEKRANAIKDMSGKGVLSVDNPIIRELKGEIDAYYDVIILIENSGLLKEIDAIKTSTALEATKRLKWGYAITHDERIYLCECIEKELKEGEKAQLKLKALGNFVLKSKALNEILSLHDKWLGNEMSDFEFFTLLNEIKDKYGLSKEVLL